MPSAKSITSCVKCKVTISTAASDYFAYIPILQQLKLVLDRHFEEIISYASNVIQNNQISDLHNAEIFKKAQEQYPNAILLPLILNIDGMKVFKSNHRSL